MYLQIFFEYLSMTWAWVSTHGKETAVFLGLSIFNAWQWYHNTRHKDKARGAKAKLEEAKSDDERFQILQTRIDRLSARESANEKRIDALEDQIVKFKRFVRQIKLNANDVYEKYKDELH